MCVAPVRTYDGWNIHSLERNTPVVHLTEKKDSRGHFKKRRSSWEVDLITHKYRYKVTSLISNIRGGFLMKSTRNQNTRYQLSALQPGRIFWKSLRLLLPHPLPWNQYAPSFQCASRETDDSKSCQLLVLTLNSRWIQGFVHQEFQHETQTAFLFLNRKYVKLSDLQEHRQTQCRWVQ